MYQEVARTSTWDRGPSLLVNSSEQLNMCLWTVGDCHMVTWVCCKKLNQKSYGFLGASKLILTRSSKIFHFVESLGSSSPKYRVSCLFQLRAAVYTKPPTARLNRLHLVAARALTRSHAWDLYVASASLGSTTSVNRVGAARAGVGWTRTNAKVKATHCSAKPSINSLFSGTFKGNYMTFFIWLFRVCGSFRLCQSYLDRGVLDLQSHLC